MSGSSEQWLTNNTDWATLQTSGGNFSKGTQFRYNNTNFTLFVKSDNLVQKPNDLDINKPIYFSGNFHYKIYREGYDPNNSTVATTINFLNFFDFNNNPIDYNVTATNNRDYIEGNFDFKSAYINWKDVTKYESGGYRISIPFKVAFDLYGVYGYRSGSDYNNHFYIEIDTLSSTAVNIVYNNPESTNYYVSDSGTQQELQDLNETQESIKETTEDTNETTHSIFDSISDFFGSFFSNLIGVFVPEDGYFSTWFNRVNTLLTNKLGILYYPFSVIIDIFTRLNTALSDAQQNTCPIYIPELGITIQGHRYVFLERQTVDLINYNIQLGNADTSNSSMFGLTSLIWVVRRFTSLVLVIAFLNMCVSKVKLIMRGSEEG